MGAGNDPASRQVRQLPPRLDQTTGRKRPRRRGSAQRRHGLNGGGRKLVEEHVEVESGKHDHNRPALHKALEACKNYGATLVIAKLDRLSRDAHFLLGLQKAGGKFVAADMPEANEMVVGMMALVAQAERRMISERTKAALQASKARGKRLGQPKGHKIPTDDAMRAKGTAVTWPRLRPLPSVCARCSPNLRDYRPMPPTRSWIAVDLSPRAAASGRRARSSAFAARLKD